MQLTRKITFPTDSGNGIASTGAAKIDELLAAMTTDELATVVSGRDIFHTASVPRLGVPALKMTDGPIGARGEEFVLGPPTALFPCGAALAATFDVRLVERVGAALGDEARIKGSQLLLGPTVNLQRTPVGGRNFECFSEDPVLTAEMAVAHVRGVQSTGVAACAKHFVCNDSEHERHSVTADVDEQTLHEVYLLPFEAACRRGSVWTIMAAYNRVNGEHCTESPYLLTDVLRSQWGWDGAVVSDCWATHSTVASAMAGLDLEIPGPPRYYGAALARAVEDGEVPRSTHEEKARRILRLRQRVGRLTGPDTDGEGPSDADAHAEVARNAAGAAVVVLKNDAVDGTPLLPIVPGTTRIAVIGPNAATARAQGGGSASVRPHYAVTPLDGIRAAANGSTVLHERGCENDRELSVVDVGRFGIIHGADATPGARIEFSAEHGSEVVASTVADRLHLVWWGPTPGGLEGRRFHATVSWTYVARRTQPHVFSLGACGKARMLLDGDELIATEDSLAMEEIIFVRHQRAGTVTVDLVAGQAYEFVVEFDSTRHGTVRGLLVGAHIPDPADVAAAVELARQADVAVVVVGTSSEWESEGDDRATLDLPGDQDRLVRAVVAANPRTVVAIVSGSAVTMDWVDDVPAVVQGWFGGQEGGSGLADVLFGAVNPSGRLPFTIPRSADDVPVPLRRPDPGGTITYAEGVDVGYRGYEAKGVEPLFAFGHGLSYTSFSYGPVDVETDPTGAGARVAAVVTNTGERAGAEVVQLYVRRPESGATRAMKAFSKVMLAPGESATVTFDLDATAFRRWDAGAHAWVVDGGEYEVAIGASSADIRGVAPVTLTGATPSS